MADSANFTADPRYAGCDQITTVGARVLNSRRAFRAQSQLVWAAQCAGRAYLQRRSGQHRSGPSPDATPWQRLQSAYGRIRVPIPEGHAARSRVARLEVGDAADLVYIGVEDLDAGGLGSKFVVAFSERPAAVENLPSLASSARSQLATGRPADRPGAAMVGAAGRQHRSPGRPGESDVYQPFQSV